MTTIYIVRHGEYVNPNYVYPGRLPGYPLSENGIQQVKKLAAALQNTPISALYASPVLRTMQTAGILAEVLHCSVVPDERLIEVHTLLDGAPMQRFDETRGELSFLPDNLARGAESMEALADRMYGFMEEKRKEHGGKEILIVTHGDPMRFGVMKYMHTPIEFEASRTVSIPLAGGYKIVFDEANQPQVYPIVTS